MLSILFHKLRSWISQIEAATLQAKKVHSDRIPWSVKGTERPVAQLIKVIHLILALTILVILGFLWLMIKYDQIIRFSTIQQNPVNGPFVTLWLSRLEWWCPGRLPDTPWTSPCCGWCLYGDWHEVIHISLVMFLRCKLTMQPTPQSMILFRQFEVARHIKTFTTCLYVDFLTLYLHQSSLFSNHWSLPGQL